MSEPPIQSSTEVFPLTSTQRGILAESLLPQERGIYVEQIVGEIEEPLQIEHFRSAWQQATVAFDALRLSLSWANGGAAQQTIASSVEVPFHVLDLRQLPGPSRSRIEEFLEQDRNHGFDLREGPLLRVSVLLFAGSKWAFVWTIHHTIIDGNSYATVLQYVFDCYERLASGQSPGVAPGPPFKDFLKWLQAQETASGAQHFEKVLDGLHEPTRLPLQQGRNELPAGRSDEARLRLDAAESEALEIAARDSGTTVNSLVQLAWGLLLCRYIDEEDVVFGATWWGRPESLDGRELLVGPCINTLPVRVSVAGKPTVRDALRALRDQHLAIRPFQHTPLHSLRLPPGLGRVIFRSNVVFEYERFDAALRRKDDRWTRRQLWSRSQTNYPLNLSAYFDRGELALDLEYSKNAFDARSASRLLADYARLLKGVAQGLDASPAALRMLEPELREALTTIEAQREVVPPRQNPMELILGQVAECPAAVAVSEIDGRSWTYQELANRFFALADELRRQGIPERAIVGILLPRSMDAIVSMLAIHAAGCAFLPLDPDDPPARLEYLIRDSQLVRVLVNGETAGTLKSAAGLELRMDTAPGAPEGARSPSIPGPGDTAYVIYTSGSTGQPKGVCISHSSIANHVSAVIERFGLCNKDRVLQFSSLSFDVALEEILPTLSAGASLVLRNEEMVSSARSFFELARRGAVTVLNLPTAFWHYLAHAGRADSWPKGVRLLIVGGERITAADLGIFREANTGHIRFLNGYGPTETTITSTLYDEAEGDHDGEVVPIGRPLSGHSHFILDRHLRPVPPGAVGQLHIGGAGMALGYLGRPELTARCFPAHPFRAGSRLYATGDLVRRTERGNCVFVGRIDHQVKLRGYRIELGEIEAFLRQHASVAEAVVVLHRPANGEAELRGFVLLRDRAVSAGALREHLTSVLPGHMVPRLLIEDELPRTPAGKVDRNALSTRELPHSHQVISFPASTDPLEQELLQIWSKLLETPVTDASTTFFEAGGHSLLVLQMLSEVERRLNRTCEAQAFLANPTVKRLAGLLNGVGVESAASPLVRLSPGRPEARPLFLAPGLMGLSSEYANLSNALHPDIPVYGIQHALLRKRDEALPGLAEAARHYAEQIRRTQPVGPYAIAGYSAAGIVAVAIAQALHEFGEKTDFVGLIDSTPPASVSIPPPFTSFRRTLRFSRTVADRFGEILEEPNAIPRLWRRSKSAVVRSLTRWFPRGTPRNQRIDEVIPDMDKQFRGEEKELMQLRLDTILSYELRQDPINVVLLRTRVDPFEGPHEPDLAWGRALTGNVVVEHLPGPHQMLLSGDGAKSLARVMERHLLNRAK